MQTINDTPKNKDSLFQTGILSPNKYGSFAETTYEKLNKAKTQAAYNEIKRVSLEDSPV